METLVDEILQKAKHKKIRLFFDMDGVCAEERNDTYESPRINNNEHDFYFHKRPIMTVVKTMKRLNKIKNIQVFIMSSCVFKNQVEQKRRWLEKYAPFIDQNNMYFVIWTEVNCSEEERPVQKAKVLEKINADFDGEFILIEDRHKNIIATNNYFGKEVSQHVSRIIK